MVHKIKKAVILAAGKGTRLRPHTHTLPKPMIKLANKPLLEIIINYLKAGGIKDICIVVGYKKEDIMSYFGDGNELGVKITYVEQKERRGIAHAVKFAKPFVGEDPFLLYLGDNLVFTPMDDILKKYYESGADVLLNLVKVSDPERFGVPSFNKNGEIVRLIEKPKNPPSNFAVIGVYVFKYPKKLFEIIEKQKPSARGEYEITDAIQALMDGGDKVLGFEAEHWFDTGKVEEFLDANERIMREHARRGVRGQVHGKNVKIIGDVEIDEGTIINSNVRIVGPCVIGKNCVIGPRVRISNTTIGNETFIQKTNLEKSIVGDNAIISYYTKLDHSFIGNESIMIRENPNRFRTIIANLKKLIGSRNSIIVGEHTKLILGQKLLDVDEIVRKYQALRDSFRSPDRPINLTFS